MNLGKLIVKKGEILQRSGELQTRIFRVESGLLRSYHIDSAGKKHIFMFAPEGWTIADSVGPDQSSDLFIDALENSVVWVYEKDVKKERKNVGKFVKRLYVLQKRIIMLMSTPAIDRYDHFMTTYPNITQRVPQKMIASYLGITPEALSKLKRMRLNKK
ncbi:MAG: Crp/Fnr family transcriptional regulator [Bacteroidota bacterium]